MTFLRRFKWPFQGLCDLHLGDQMVTWRKLELFWFLWWWSSASSWLSTNESPMFGENKPIATNKKTSVYLQRIWFFNRKKCLQTFVSSNQLDVKIPDLQLPFVLWPCPSSERFPWTGQKLRPKAEVQTRTLSPRLSRAGACCSYFVWDAKTPKNTKQNTTTTTRTTSWSRTPR